MAAQELGCEIFMSYACMEVGRIAVECSAHHGLHVNADHVLMEIMNGDRPARTGEWGEVVLTALNQSAMPFIRYRLGDLTAWAGESCRCGSTLPVIRAPEGRIEEPLRFRGGEQLSPTRVFIALRALDIVERYVVIQESLDCVRVQIVPTRPWSEDELDRLRLQLLEGMPSGVRVDLDLVERIEQAPGKYRQMISRLRES
mgnify:CR=1 FL=1